MSDTDANPPEGGDAGEQPSGGQDPSLKAQVGFLTRKLQQAEKLISDFNAAEEKRKKDSMSALDRAKAEAEEYRQAAAQAEARAREALIRSGFLMAAGKAGVVDPDAAYVLADKAALTLGEDGTLSGADVALAGLKESRSYLFSAPKPAEAPEIGSGGGNPGDTTGGHRTFTAAQIMSMPPDEFAKLNEMVLRGEVSIT